MSEIKCVKCGVIWTIFNLPLETCPICGGRIFESKDKKEAGTE